MRSLTAVSFIVKLATPTGRLALAAASRGLVEAARLGFIKFRWAFGVLVVGGWRGLAPSGEWFHSRAIFRLSAVTSINASPSRQPKSHAKPSCVPCS